MSSPHEKPSGPKSSVEEIRARFDADVERFSNLETGQTATMDAAVCMELVTRAAVAVTPGARRVLDIGCGAGNYTLKLLERVPSPSGVECTLIDLSRPMLDRAVGRVSAAGAGRVTAVQGDVRGLDLGAGRFDVVLAAAVLHHLRTEAEWEAVFGQVFRALAPGGCFWIFDMVEASGAGVRGLMRGRYGEYLATLKDEAYRDHVFAYVEREDTPRPLMYQLELLGRTGFAEVDVLHKNGPFAAFGGVRRGL